MKRNIILFFLIFITTAFFSLDNDKIELSIESAVTMGLKNSADLKMEDINLENAKFDVASSYSNIVPDMSFQTGLLKYNDDPEVYLKLNFNLSLSINAASIFSIYETVIDLKIGRIKQETAKKQIENNIKKNYYTLLLLSEQIELTKEYLKGIEDRVNITKKMFDEGIAPKIDLMKSQYSHDMVKIELEKMNVKYQCALLEFQNIIGLKDNALPVFKDKLEITDDKTIDFNAILNNQLSENCELKAILNSIEKLTNQRNSSIGALTPSLELYYNYSNGFSQNITDNILSGDNYLSLSIALPIDVWLPFSKQQLDLIQAQNKIKGMNDYYKEKYEQIKVKIHNIVQTINESKRTSNLLKNDVLISEEIFKLSNKLYEVGNKSLYEVESHHKDFIDTRLNYLNQIYNYKIGIINLEYILNTKL